MLSLQAPDVVIWSIDLPTPREVRRGVKAMKGLKRGKIDRAFMEGRHLSLIGRFQEDLGIDVFDDAKIIEIPTKLVEVARKHLKYRPWMLNCMAGDVSTMELKDPQTMDGLKRFADACHAVGTKPCAVTVLTSKSDKVVRKEYNGRTSIDQVLVYVDMIRECGFTDVVCSPQEVEAIRSDRRFDELDLNTPGIVLAGGDAQDQARTNTPAAALEAGSDRLVIGRALTEGNWAENFRRVVNEVEAAIAA